MAAPDPKLLSPLWRHVANIRPRLRAHAQIHRHVLRGRVWYVLQDHSSGRFHRFPPALYQLIGQMDGRRTMQEIWLTAAAELGDACPSQDECIQLLGRLHGADALRGDLAPDVDEIAKRARTLRRRRRLMSVRSPLSLRIPLVDPDAFLDATAWLVRPLFGWIGAALWLLAVGWGVSLAATHWNGLTTDFADRVLAADNLVLLWFTFPVVKAIHELGHGYAVKAWGGEVHEMGIMMLVFVPVPYVEASASAAFPSKWQRAVVGAAGMLAEAPVAVAALWFWTEAEPSIARSIAYNVVLIAGVSTLLFNGNPLLRYDGHYILMDLVELPNLGSRSIRYVGYILQRYLLGVERVESPADAPDERVPLFIFAFASYLYRLSVMTAIVLFVATKFFTIGVLLACWSATLMIGWPITKGIYFLLTSPVLRGRRVRALGVTFGSLAAIAGVLLFVPAPLATMAEGVVWPSERSVIRAQSGGVVSQVLPRPGDWLTPGQPVLVMSDPMLRAQVRVLQEQERELLARRKALTEDPFGLRVIEREIAHIRERLELARSRLADLTVRAPGEGVFLSPGLADLPGRYLAKGDLIGFVTDLHRPTVRVAVPAADIDLLRERTRSVEVRLSDRPEEILSAHIDQIAPSATKKLPNAALGVRGGGKISVAPTSNNGVQALDDLFNVELGLSLDEGLNRIGGRVYVKFEQGSEPLGLQLFRKVRRMFLRRFNV